MTLFEPVQMRTMQAGHLRKPVPRDASLLAQLHDPLSDREIDVARHRIQTKNDMCT